MRPAHLLADRFQIAAPEGFSAGHACPVFTRSGLAEDGTGVLVSIKA